MKVSKLLVFLLFSFIIISNIMDKTFFSRITVLYLIAKVERKNSFYSKHGIIFCQKEKRSQMFQVKAISKDVRKTIVCSCYVTYAFQSESTPYSCLNVKEVLAWSRREIWSLSDCNWTRTHNHLVHKQTLNHLVFDYELSGCGFESSCSQKNDCSISQVSF